MYSYFITTLSDLALSPHCPGVGDWGGLPHPECRLLSLFGSRINPGWTLCVAVDSTDAMEGRKLIVGVKGRGSAFLGNFPNQMPGLTNKENSD